MNTLPCEKEIHLIVFPQVLEFALIVFQQYQVHHLTKVIEVCSQFMVGNVLNHCLNPLLPCKSLYDVGFCHNKKYHYPGMCYLPITNMAASLACSDVLPVHPEIILK